MKLTFLEASNGTPLTKTFSKTPEGALQKSNYPHVLSFTSHDETVRTIAAFHKALVKHAKHFHCLLKGEVQRPLQNESRAGSTDSAATTQWLCLDFDGVAGIKDVEAMLEALPSQFQGVDHIIQYSSSMGVDPDKGLSAHVFMLLDQPYLPSVLKDWLTHINLTTDTLREAIMLSRTKTVLKWPLDITVAQNDKLLYIAPPICRGVKDKFKGERIQLVKGKRRKLTPHLDAVSAERNRANTSQLLNQLREAEGLPRRQHKEKVVKGVTVAAQPGQATVTGIKETEDFVYLNLNGGDSWAYYHPVQSPEVLYNFKGEPNYLIRDLMPEYYKEARKKATPDPSELAEEGVHYLAFLDVKSDTYFRGTYNPYTNRHEVHRTSSLKKLQDFLRQHGQPVGDFVPEWDVEFRYDSDFVIDEEARRLNTYQPTRYLMDAKPAKKLPPITEKTIRHMLNYDDEAVEHFLNWLAVIFQHRMKTNTAWVLHGTQGTGKGTLFHKILTPLIGEQYTAKTKLNYYSGEFNGFLEEAVFVLIDECQFSSVDNGGTVMDNIKDYIAEPTIPLRRMRTDVYKVRNYSNFILTANRHDPIQVDPEDRRFNVAPRQEKRLRYTPEEYKAMDKEVQTFANYIMHRKADISKAMEPLMNEQRRILQALTRDSAETVADAVRSGDFEFLWDNRPSMDMAGELMERTRSQLPSYDEALREIIAHEKTGFISRDALHTIFFYTTGNAFETPNKFTKFLGHKGINLKKVKAGGKTTAGLNGIDWTIPPEAAKALKADKQKLRRVK